MPPSSGYGISWWWQSDTDHPDGLHRICAAWHWTCVWSRRVGQGRETPGIRRTDCQCLHSVGDLLVRVYCICYWLKLPCPGADNIRRDINLRAGGKPSYPRFHSLLYPLSWCSHAGVKNEAVDDTGHAAGLLFGQLLEFGFCRWAEVESGGDFFFGFPPGSGAGTATGSSAALMQAVETCSCRCQDGGIGGRCGPRINGVFDFLFVAGELLVFEWIGFHRYRLVYFLE